MAVQWLRHPVFTARGTDLILDWGTKIMHATFYGQKKERKFLSLNKNENITYQHKKLYTYIYIYIILYICYVLQASQMAQMVKNLPAMRETWV